MTTAVDRGVVLTLSGKWRAFVWWFPPKGWNPRPGDGLDLSALGGPVGMIESWRVSSELESVNGVAVVPGVPIVEVRP